MYSGRIHADRAEKNCGKTRHLARRDGVRKTARGANIRKLLKIDGMSCGHCVMRVQSALESLPGVSSARVDLLERSAMVEGENLDDQALRAAVAEEGYKVLSIMP